MIPSPLALAARPARRASMAAAVLWSLGIAAQPVLADEGAPYIGANVGYTVDTYRHADLDSQLISQLSDAGYPSVLSSSTVRNEGVPWSVNLGYRFSPYFAVEASFIELATLKYAAKGTATTVLGSAPLAVDLTFKSHGPALAFVGVLPMTNHWDLEARLGAYEGKTVSESLVTIDPNSASAADSKTETSLLADVGMAYIVGAHWVLRLNYTHLSHLSEKALNSSFNVDLLTGGLTYVF